MSLLEENKSSFEKAIEYKVLSPENMEALSAQLKAQGKTLATLNGSFDLLHPGHLDMLYQASSQADVLIVLLNSDASIQSYKSPKRPIHPLKIRLLQMAALAMVDYVSWFEETDPRVILEKIQPNVHVNGNEYGENCVEAEVVQRGGGRIHIVQLVPGYSTSKIIQKIKEL